VAGGADRAQHRVVVGSERVDAFNHHIDRATKLETAELVKSGRVGVAIDGAWVRQSELQGDHRGTLPVEKGRFDFFALRMAANDAFSFMALGNLELGLGEARAETGAFAFGDFMKFAM